MKSLFRLVCWLVAIAALQLALLTEPASAADFAVSTSALAGLPPNSQEAVSALVQQQAHLAYQQLLLKVDEVDRVCDLSDARRAKLEVAAKGAVDHALPGWLQTNAASLGANTNVARPRDDEAVQRAKQQLQALQRQERQLDGRRAEVQDLLRRVEKADRARLEAALAQQRAALVQRREALEKQVVQLQQLDRVVLLGGFVDPKRLAPQQLRVQLAQPPAATATVRQRARSGQIQANEDLSAAAEKERTWTAALTYMLTTQQSARLAAEARLRAAQRPRTAAQLVLAEIDERLLLDSAQRSQLEDLVETELQKLSLPEVTSNPALARAVADHVLKRIPRDSLAGVLSDVQMMHYRRSIESQAAPQ